MKKSIFENLFNKKQSVLQYSSDDNHFVNFASFCEKWLNKSINSLLSVEKSFKKAVTPGLEVTFYKELVLDPSVWEREIIVENENIILIGFYMYFTMKQINSIYQLAEQIYGESRIDRNMMKNKNYLKSVIWKYKNMEISLSHYLFNEELSRPYRFCLFFNIDK